MATETIADTLKRMRRLMNRLPAARFRVEMAKSKAEKCTAAITGMPHGANGGESQVESGVERIMLAKNRLSEILAELAELEAMLAPLVDGLENPLERTVMRLRYFDRLSARDIAYRMAYSEPYVFRLLDRAVKKLEQEEMQ